MYKKRHVDNHLEYLQVSLIPQTQYHSEMEVLLTWTSRARGPMLRPMRLLPRPTPTLSHGLMPSKFSEDCPCTLASSLWTHFTLILWKLTIFFSGLRTYSRRNTSTFKGSPFKPIIVYVAAPEMSSAWTCTPSSIIPQQKSLANNQLESEIYGVWHHVRQAQDLFTIDIHCRDRGEACPGGDLNTWTRASKW